MSAKTIVVDANILIRAVLGEKVRDILTKFGETVDFYAPASAFIEAAKHLPTVIGKRGRDPRLSVPGIDSLRRFVRELAPNELVSHHDEAFARIGRRDPDDWPIVAAALALGCPIWTEDQDFFGTGIATWTTDRVEIYLRASGDKTGKPT